MKALAEIAITLTILAAAAGNLPWIIKQAQIAQLHILVETKSSNWGTPWTPPSRQPFSFLLNPITAPSITWPI